jgi:arylsulfatase A-like enzyme
MKNIILLITDTFRFDNLFERARNPIRTPELDRFAETRATELTGFIAGSFPTIPHRTDLITGRLGWPRYGWQSLRDSSRNAFPRLLAQRGYATQLICDCPHLFNSGFQHTFQAAFQHRGQEGDKPLLHLNDPITRVQPCDKTRLLPMFHDATLADQHRWTNRYYRYESETFMMKTAASAARFLEENSEANPFFLWVDFFDPHEPWDAPEYLVRRYQAEYDGTPMLHPNYGPSDAYTPDELRNLWAHYAAEAELVDRAIGRVIQKMDDLQLWDDSVLVVTSDHGTSLGEHGRTGKTNISEEDDRYWPLYPEVSHVPFLVAGGDIPSGASSAALAQPQDILPTLCELAGASVDAPEAVEGLSFADVVTGTGTRHRDCALAATHENWQRRVDDGRLPKGATTPFLVTEAWGYAPLGAAGDPELFDLGADPLAEQNVAASHPDTVEAMKAQFLAHIAALPGGDAACGFWSSVL